jgi:hypothetical protein
LGPYGIKCEILFVLSIGVTCHHETIASTRNKIKRGCLALLGVAWRCLALLGVTRGGKMLLKFIGIVTGFPVFCLKRQNTPFLRLKRKKRVFGKKRKKLDYSVHSRGP